MTLEVERLAPCRKLTLLIRKAQTICLSRDLGWSVFSWLSSSILNTDWAGPALAGARSEMFSLTKWLAYSTEPVVTFFMFMNHRESSWKVEIKLPPLYHCHQQYNTGWPISQEVSPLYKLYIFTNHHAGWISYSEGQTRKIKTGRSVVIPSVVL